VQLGKVMQNGGYQTTSLDKVKEFGGSNPLWSGESKYELGTLEFVSDILMSTVSRNRGIYSESALARMISEPGVGGRQLWGALSLELWHQQYIDN
jgi:hypothetical protein